jgi:hypothetical protein
VRSVMISLMALAACGGSSKGAGDVPPDAGANLEGATSASPDAGTGAQSDVAVEAGSTPCASMPLCDDFEHDPIGTAPAGWSVSMGCNPDTVDASVDGGGLLVGVDGAQHHSGNNSVRVVGGDSCGYSIVDTAAFASLGTDVYARFWVMFSGAPTPNHNGFLSMATSSGDHLRLGFQDQVVAWNAQLSDATLPDMDPQGTSGSVATTPGTWQCVEFHVGESIGHLEFWLDGQAVPGLSYDGGDVQGVNDQWSRGAPSPMTPVDFSLGWLGLNDQRTVWYDDVALGNARIGCD